MVGLVPLHKAPPININHLALGAIVASKHIKATYFLAKALTNLGCPKLLLVGQTGNKPNGYEKSLRIEHVYSPYFFAFCVPPNNAVYNWGFACFRMDIFLAHGIYLDIFRVVYFYELLVCVRSIGSRVIQSGINLAGFVANLVDVFEWGS